MIRKSNMCVYILEDDCEKKNVYFKPEAGILFFFPGPLNERGENQILNSWTSHLPSCHFVLYTETASNI